MAFLLRRAVTRAAAAAVAATLSAGLAACGNGDGNGDDADGLKAGRLVGLLLPEDGTRQERSVRPAMEARVAALCEDCRFRYGNAAGDAELQKQQFDDLLTRGVDVIVLGAVDPDGTASWVTEAAEQGVPVVAHDRPARGDIDAFITYDSHRVGQVQGEAMLAVLGDEAEGAPLVMMNGPAADPDAAAVKAGALDVLTPVVDLVLDRDVERRDPAVASARMTEAVRELGPDGFAGVHAADDRIAAGVLSALRAEGVPGVPVGGQGAGLAALRRIVTGEQAFTVHTPPARQAEITAEIAVRLLDGEDFADLAADRITTPTTEDVPSALLEPVAVTLGTLEEAVLADGTYTLGELCGGAYADACAEAGIRPPPPAGGPSARPQGVSGGSAGT
ncbi:substrate-binding domain-containing protein [Streptomyces sp. ACA25]|uniref:substrate-binding domain-containing protein n=1 Tax=Streptomyces sp. ACA25 TaxID=3022596 RepID=UPI002307B564|nr:substrate-binding domain-containing protein [Streptomyces sp. ACA25]MDB1089150.1 substrate-binding domain-containing protein [Streptomyces sp. ACA25]